MIFENAARAVDDAIASRSETGAALAVTKDGETVFTHSAGLRDAENAKPFTEDTICRAFSCSKIVTSVCAMQLMERGKLDIYDELAWYIPSFSEPCYIRDGKKLPSQPVRLRDLLNMTSGIPYPGDGREGGEMMSSLWGRLDQSIREGRSMTTQEFASEAGKCALVYPAGQEWMYGSSADILGAVIEKAADMPLDEYMKVNVFDPLGMEDTAFFVPPEKRDRLAELYECAGETPRKPSYVNLCIYDYDSRPAFLSGGAGLFSTAADYAKLGAELSCGKAGILGRKTRDLLRLNGLSAEQRVTLNWDSVKGFGYANLMRTLEDRELAGLLASEGSFGWDGWTGTFLLCDPTEKISVTLFLQRCGAGTSRLARCAVNAVFGNER
ncbi:MAG: beta-lactamase family protein [Ruminococcus sp.]|nr:beta-lactamase family protein [Ruminococcus sp.]